MSISFWISIMFVVFVGVGFIIAGVVLFSNSDKDLDRDYCGDEVKCEPVNLTLGPTDETISLPTHCLHIFDKENHKCAWVWPEGLDEVFNIDEYIDPNETTKNLRDWAKNRSGAIFPHIDLNKFPQHHQTVEIVAEGNCPTPFMDFIVFGETNTNEKFGVCAVLPNNVRKVFNQLGFSSATP